MEITRWPDEVYEGLDYVRIGEKTVYTYKNMPETLYTALAETARKYPDRTALVDPDGKEYTFSEYLALVDGFAGYLRFKKKIMKGDHVGVVLGNGIEFAVTYLEIVKLGAVFVSLPGKCKKPELLSLAEKADLTFLICEEKRADWFAGIEQKLIVNTEQKDYGLEDLRCDWPILPCEGRSKDPVILMFTSGTTSLSKGVLLKNYNVMHSVEAYIRTLKLTENDSTIIATPMYHITGLVCLLAVFLTTGGKVYLHRKVDADAILSCMVENSITFYHAAPTVFTMLLEHRGEYPHIPSVKGFAAGSSNMAPEKIINLHCWMPQAKFHTVYGMTETSGAGTIFPGGAADSAYLGSSGIPMPDLKVRILDEEEQDVPVGEIGEVCLKGGFVLEDYYKYTGPSAFTADGWLKTGDIGRLNEDGYLYIVDRKKDMINRGGEKICSFDVENEIQRIEGVIDVAVVPVPDDKYVELPGAMIRLKEGYHYKAEEMRELLKKRLAKYKIPVYYKFVNEIPVTKNGKIDKREIQKQMLQ